jgi:hypothetical protein
MIAAGEVLDLVSGFCQGNAAENMTDLNSHHCIFIVAYVGALQLDTE